MTEFFSGGQQAMSAKDLQGRVNGSARDHFPELAKRTGIRIPFMPTRLGLRRETPYPYSFTEADSLYPENPLESFGRIILKDRDAGLKEIHARISELDAEHSWIFIPSASLWIDDTQASL